MLWIELAVPRQRCTQCNYTFIFDYGLGLIHSSTASFRREIVQRCKGRALSDVACEYNLPYTTVERWFYWYAPEQFHDEIATRICVDEFAIRKGHTYATSVLNADTGHVLTVVPNRNQEAIETGKKTIS
ncbi:transposase [Bacillus pacificus]